MNLHCNRQVALMSARWSRGERGRLIEQASAAGRGPRGPLPIGMAVLVSTDARSSLLDHPNARCSTTQSGGLPSGGLHGNILSNRLDRVGAECPGGDDTHDE